MTEIELSGMVLVTGATRCARRRHRAAAARNRTAVHVTQQQALAAGLFAGWVNSQEWVNEVGYAVDIDPVRSHGVALTPLDAATAHRDSIRVPAH